MRLQFAAPSSTISSATPTREGAHFGMVFHPDSKLYFNRDGKFTIRTSGDYIPGAAGKPAADERSVNGGL